MPLVYGEDSRSRHGGLLSFLETTRFKLLVAVLSALLLVFVILQNTEPVATRILFMTVTMPRAALLGLAALIGFTLGLMTAYSLARPPRE